MINIQYAYVVNDKENWYDEIHCEFDFRSTKFIPVYNIEELVWSGTISKWQIHECVSKNTIF